VAILSVLKLTPKFVHWCWEHGTPLRNDGCRGLQGGTFFTQYCLHKQNFA